MTTFGVVTLPTMTGEKALDSILDDIRAGIESLKTAARTPVTPLVYEFIIEIRPLFMNLCSVAVQGNVWPENLSLTREEAERVANDFARRYHNEPYSRAKVVYIDRRFQK